MLVTDLDNTLWDWVEIWHRSFSALLDKIVEISGADRSSLEDEIRAVHRRHGTSEYAFLIESLPTLQRIHNEADLGVIYEPAIRAYRSARTNALRLYPGVLPALQSLVKTGTLLIGYTESMSFYTNYRLRNTELDQVLDYLYSPEDHDLPRDLTAEEIRQYPKEHYELAKTEHRHTPTGELKPNPRLLLDIIADVGANPSQCVYVGDSKMKDIAMAKAAGIDDVWAEYGTAQHREDYDLLRRVTHWTAEEVQRERDLMESGSVVPSHAIQRFDEILHLFSFSSFS